MQIYGPGQIHGPQPMQGPHFTRPTGQTPAVQQPDQVDISPAADAAAQAADGGFRAELVARVKSEIAAGTYETTDKLAGAVDRLLDEMG